MGASNNAVVTVIKDIGRAQSGSEAILVPIHGTHLGQKYDVRKTEMIIGRSSQCDIQIDHESISRRHAKLRRELDSVYIEDLSSTNGTYVDGTLVSEALLRSGQAIKIGRSIIRFLQSTQIDERYHQEICWVGKHDALSTCLNKLTVMSMLERETSRSLRYDRELSLVFIGVNNFDKINKKYGHLAGDSVVTHLGEALNQATRSEDFVGRLTGAEFVLVAPEISSEGLNKLMHRLKTQVCPLDYRFDGAALEVDLGYGASSLHEIEVEPPSQVHRKPESLLRDPTNVNLSPDSVTAPGGVQDSISEAACAHLLKLARTRSYKK